MWHKVRVFCFELFIGSRQFCYQTQWQWSLHVLRKWQWNFCLYCFLQKLPYRHNTLLFHKKGGSSSKDGWLLADEKNWGAKYCNLWRKLPQFFLSKYLSPYIKLDLRTLWIPLTSKCPLFTKNESMKVKTTVCRRAFLRIQRIFLL